MASGTNYRYDAQTEQPYSSVSETTTKVVGRVTFILKTVLGRFLFTNFSIFLLSLSLRHAGEKITFKKKAGSASLAPESVNYESPR